MQRAEIRKKVQFLSWEAAAHSLPQKLKTNGDFLRRNQNTQLVTNHCKFFPFFRITVYIIALEHSTTI